MSSLITHTVFILETFPRLHAQKNIMSFCIRIISIMNVIGHHQLDTGLPAHAKQLLIYMFLLRNAVILQFQKEISFAEDFFIAKCCCLCLFVKPSCHSSCNFTCKTSTECNNSFMIFFQYFFIHTWFVIKSIYKTQGYDFDKILVSFLIFSKKHQMIITVLFFSHFFVKAGTGSHIDLASKNRLNSCCFCRLIKINATKHDTVVSYGCTIHSQFFHSGYIFIYFVGTV